MSKFVFPLIAGLVAGCSAAPEPGSSRPPSMWMPQPVQGGSGASAAGQPAGTGGSNIDNPLGIAGSPVMSPAGSGGSDAGIVDADVPDAPLTSDNSCGKGKAEAKLKPVNMFVMFDRSGSMDDDDKWTDASAALGSFFRDPGIAGMRIALRFFPHNSPAEGCDEDECDALACSQPLVSIGELLAESAPVDAQEDALIKAVASSAPGGRDDGGGTPIFAALDGALRWSTAHAAAHQDENTVVVFVTDGEPNGCIENFTEISKLAADALANHGVSTYAIGLEGSNGKQMNQLAQAGGTTQGIFIGTGASAEQELIAALDSIRGQTLSCDFPMPAATDPSMTIDPKRVNVTFTPSSGMPGTLAQVGGQPACGASKSWYYDAPDNPSRIHLCPAACDLVRNDSKAVLEVLLGCATACGGLDVDCGGTPPPPDVPPIVL